MLAFKRLFEDFEGKTVRNCPELIFSASLTSFGYFDSNFMSVSDV